MDLTSHDKVVDTVPLFGERQLITKVKDTSAH